jgi:hypothetical protein
MDHPQEQAFTLLTTTRAILRDPAFRRGFNDKRSGAAFDPDLDKNWAYGRGRQFACIVPLAFQLFIAGKLNPVAVRVFDGAFFRNWII